MNTVTVILTIYAAWGLVLLCCTLYRMGVKRGWRLMYAALFLKWMLLAPVLFLIVTGAGLLALVENAGKSKDKSTEVVG